MGKIVEPHQTHGGLGFVCTVVCSFVGWFESHMIYSSKQFRLLGRDSPGKIAKCSRRRPSYAGKIHRRSVSIRRCTFTFNAKVFCSAETEAFLSIHTAIECSQSDKRLFRTTRILLLARESFRLSKGHLLDTMNALEMWTRVECVVSDCLLGQFR